MKTSLVLLALSLLACSVWKIHGHRQEVDPDDQEVVEGQLEKSMVTVEKRMQQQLKVFCKACESALKRVKKSISTTSRQEEIKQKLLSVCGNLPFGKSTCEDLVKKHLWVMIDELNTSDGARTICVKIKACKPKKFWT